ncbi:MAG: hypothetical protein H6737_09460 [Alphaproteobacteria bacterium]|nr:hypothetical protein [Alphaproteobacteria bacterium]
MKPIVVAAALLAAAPALATDIREPFSGKRPNTLEFHGGFAYYGYGLAGGLRFGIPIVDNGFIGPINNSVYITIGADFYLLGRVPGYGTGGGVGIGVPVMLQWNFYFTDEWSAFGEAGINPYLDSYFFDGNGIYTPYWVGAAIGGRYHMSNGVALIGRVGTPYASFGAEINF